jgi:flagellar hook-length control protein FliK
MAAWQATPVRGAVAPQPPVAALAPPPAGAPVAGEHATERNAARARPFAELLRENRIDNAAPAAPAAPSPKPTAEAGAANAEVSEPSATPTPTTKARPRTAAATTTKAAPGPHRSDDANGPGPGDKEHSATRDGVGTATAPSDVRGDAWMTQALAGDATVRGAGERGAGARGADEQGPGGAAAVASNADADVLAATAPARGAGNDARAGARSDADEARLPARTERIGVSGDAPAETLPLASALAEARRATDAVPHRPVTEARGETLAAVLAAGGSSPANELRAAPASSELALPTPTDSADFGTAFGVQVSLLAQDGVQQAELHLNPAETGPVSIHITVDGSQARIDFGADLAATRVAIEKSLPELAAALRDAGMTLTGGGVSQHAGGRSSAGDDGTPAPRARAGSSGAASDAPAVRGPRRVVAGGVDLYA